MPALPSPDRSSWPPPILIHDLPGARVAAEAASTLKTGLHLRTGAGAAAYLGIDWFCALERVLMKGHPDLPRRLVLDCAGETGLALLALRRGVRLVRSSAEDETRRALQAFAAANGGELDGESRPPLDLLDRKEPGEACRQWYRAWLAGNPVPDGEEAQGDAGATSG